MEISNANNINFTSVIPVRVYEAGSEIRNTDIVQKACRQVTKILAGPVKEKPEYKDFIKELNLKDPDFLGQRSWDGYCNKMLNETPSDYFKIVFDQNNRAYILTGEESKELSRLGKQIGIERGECKKAGIKTSNKLEAAKEQYGLAVKESICNLSKRLKQEYTNVTKSRIGNPTEIHVNVITKINKKDPTKNDVALRNLYFDVLG